MVFKWGVERQGDRERKGFRGWNKVQWIWTAVVVNDAVTRKVELDFAHVRFYRKFSFHVINYSMIRLYFFSNFSSAIVWEGREGCVIRLASEEKVRERERERERKNKRFVFVYLCETRIIIKKKKRQRIRLKDSERCETDSEDRMRSMNECVQSVFNRKAASRYTSEQLV